jgi:hypothetical protein
MNWFQRHLNWTVVIAVYVPQIFVGLMVGAILTLVSPLSPTWVVILT